MHFRKLITNFFSLSLFQGINYLLPLLLMPYIITKVGISNYGISNYILAVFMPLKIVIDYGYSLSGVKDIADNKTNCGKVSDIVSQIVCTRVFLLTCIFLLLVLTVFFLPAGRDHWALLLLSYSMMVGQSLIPTWFYQAVEKAGMLVVMSFITRVLYVSAVLFLIHQPEDYIFLNFYLGVSDILLGIGCLGHMIMYQNIKLHIISRPELIGQLKANFSLANVNLFTTISLTFPMIVLGVFSSRLVLGYYSVADKILQVLRASVVILYSSSFPRVIELYKQSMQALARFIVRLQVLIVLVYIPVFLICFFFPEKLLMIFVQNAPAETLTVLRFFSLIPLIAAFDIIPSHLLLIGNKNMLFARLFGVSSIFSIIVSFLLVYNFNYIGAAASAVLVEAFMLTLLLYFNRELMNKLVFKNGS